MDGLSMFVREETNNTRIIYEPSGAWSSVPKSSSIFQIGNMGAPVSSLLATASNGSVSFTFEGIHFSQPSQGITGRTHFLHKPYFSPGTYIGAFISYVNPSNMPTEPRNVGRCSVDNQLFGTSTPSSTSQNNWPFCSSSVLADGIHTFTMNFSMPQSVQVNSPMIYLDYLLFAPSPTHHINSTASDVSIVIEPSDSSIKYSGDFVIESDTDTTRLSNINSHNGSITVPFFGQQLTWYGAYSTSLPSALASAEYSIDGGTPIRFSFGGFNADSTLLNQLLFQTEILPQGSHKLVATYVNDGSQAPLSLSAVVVRNFSSTTNELTSTLPFSTNSPGQSTSTGLHNHQGAIIGVVIGILVILITIGVVLRRHLKARVPQCLKARMTGMKEEQPKVTLVQDEVSVFTITPDASEIIYIGHIPETNDSLLIPDRNAIFSEPPSADHGSTETLINASRSYITHTPTPTPTLTPLKIPRLPVMNFPQKVTTRLVNNSEAQKDVSQNQIRPANDVEASNIHQGNQRRPLRPAFSARYSEISETTTSRIAQARAVTLRGPTTREQPSRMNLQVLDDEEVYMDSGVRLGRQTLIYDETSSAEWSLRSKSRQPPVYSHD